MWKAWAHTRAPVSGAHGRSDVDYKRTFRQRLRSNQKVNTQKSTLNRGYQHRDLTTWNSYSPGSGKTYSPISGRKWSATPLPTDVVNAINKLPRRYTHYDSLHRWRWQRKEDSGWAKPLVKQRFYGTLNGRTFFIEDLLVRQILPGHPSPRGRGRRWGRRKSPKRQNWNPHRPGFG